MAITTIFFKGFAATSFAMLVASPALAQKQITYDARFNAKFPAVATARSIGVLPFNGNDGGNFTAALTSQLQAAQIDEAAVFDIKTLDSMNFRSAEGISRSEIAKAIQLGQKLGVKVVFTGVITSASVNQNAYTKEESYCAESSGFLKCNRTATRNIPCFKVNAQYSVTPQAIRVDNGQIIYSETISLQGDYSVCNGQVESTASLGSMIGSIFGSKKDKPASTQISSPEALLNKLRQDAAESIRRQVAPYNRSISVTMKERGDGLSKEDQKMFLNGVAFADGGRMDRACSIFETLNADRNKTNVPLLYNLGVCQEVLLPDDPAAALEYYAKADQLLSRPDKLVSAAYLRTKTMVGQNRSIARNRQ